MAPPSPDWQPACSHCFEGENFLTYSHSFFFFLRRLLSPIQSVFLCFGISLSFCRQVYVSVKERKVCDGLSVCLCVCMHAVLHAVCVRVGACVCGVCSTWAKYKKKSVDGRRSSLIAWLINQLHWLHVDPGLLSGGLAQGPLWAHNDSLAHSVRASSGL